MSSASVAIVAVRNKTRVLQQDLQNQATSTIEALNVAAVDAFYTRDGDYLGDLITAIERESSVVVGGRIYDSNGWILGDANDPSALYNLEPDPFFNELIAGEGMYFECADELLIAGKVVTVGDEILGAIRLELSTADMQARLDAQIRRKTEVAITSISLGALLALAIARGITVPLQSMARATKRMAEGDLNQRLRESGSTELAALARSFNQMTKQWHLNLLRKGAIQYYALDPIVTLDIDGKILEFNGAAERVFGYRRNQVLGADFVERIVAIPWRQPIRSVISGYLQGEPSDLMGQWTELRVLRKDGREFPADFSISCVAVEGEALFTVMVRDITERKLMEEQLRQEARHDPLTGLSNRSDFNRCLDRYFQRYKQNPDAAFAVLFLDFDRFKVINDSLGHKIGDLLLVNIARRLRGCVRPGDAVARLGGDEFTVLLENIDEAGLATSMADRILQTLQAPFNLDGHQVSITVSIGIVLSNSIHRSAEDILRDADITMYSAKAAGRDQYLLFDKTIGEKAQNRWQLEQDLRQAMFKEEFHLCYQPIVETHTGTLVGFEALLRWNHSDRGLIPPGDFIPIAEESGTICLIGLWVLRAGCRQMVAWQQRYPSAPPLTLSVNLSCKQIYQSDLVQQIERILLETGFSPERLKLEITETTLMDNFEDALEHCSALRKLGIQIYIDDFGTGYSSLSYLNKLPIDALKIDRSFISNSQLEGNNWKIVQTIFALARGMGIDAIAEGVEDAQQMSQLASLGCNYLQGYFIAKPLNDTEATSFLLEACRDPSDDADRRGHPMYSLPFN